MPLLQSVSALGRTALGQESGIVHALRPRYARFLEWRYGQTGMPWSINGQSFRVDPGYRREMATEYDPEVAAYLAARVKPGDCCLDVGANVGVYALQFARWSAPTGMVFAFEPNPASRAVLERHVEMNRLKGRVEVVPFAAGREPGEVMFTACGTSGMSRVGHANPLLAGDRDLVTHTVQRTTIDQFCRERCVRPRCLFIDVEGHEIAVLQGSLEVLSAAGGGSVLVGVELHPAAWPNAGSKCSDLEDLLARISRRAVAPAGGEADLTQHGTVFLEPL
jgi:FkbM family methyltransferase